MNTNQTVDIVYQGVPGSYSEASLAEFCALHKINHSPIEERGFFEGLFNSISNKTGLGWVPVSNSHAGTVHQSIDMFLKHDVEVLAEHYFSVDHCLAVKPGVKMEDIKTAHSHVQALAQSADFLNKRNIASLAYHDTAAAAEMVAKEGTGTDAAVCSERAAEMYGLDIIARKIQSDPNNTTRFLLVKTRENNFDFEDRLEKGDSYDFKTTVIFAADDNAGSLHKCISGFAGANMNMSKLESRRVNDGKYDYLFYLDFDCHLEHPASQGALAVLQQHSSMVRILGTYKKFDHT